MLEPDTQGKYRSKGKWLTNIQTNSYDVARPGTWQRLVALVETTPNTAGGHLAIEKGNLEGRIAATIRLDDVRLELLQSPQSPVGLSEATARRYHL